MDIKDFDEKNCTKYRYRHKKLGYVFRVENILKSLSPDTGEWYDAILYRQVGSGKLFVRSEDSFIKNFDIITEN